MAIGGGSGRWGADMGWAGGLPGCVKTDEAFGWLDS